MSRLRKLMEERGLDVGLLGAALNISDSEMEEIVDKDDLSPLDEVIGELARVFDMDVEDLIQFTLLRIIYDIYGILK